MEKTNVNIDEAIEKLKSYSFHMQTYSEDSLLFDRVFKFSGNKDKLSKIKDEIAGNGLRGSIRILRYVFAQKLENYDIDSAGDIGDTIEEIKTNFNRKNVEYFEKYLAKEQPQALEYIRDYKNKNNNAFSNWGAYYRYLLPFIYSVDDRIKVWDYIKIVINKLLEDLDISDEYECISTPNRWGEKIKSYYGFEGPSNYGSARAAIMIHPKAIPDHKNAIQFYCGFSHGVIEAGVGIGWSIDKSIRKKLSLPDTNISSLQTYNELLNKFKSIKNIVLEANNKLLELNADVSQNKIIIENDAETEGDKDETSNLFDVDRKGNLEKVSDIIKSTKVAKHFPIDVDYLQRDVYAKFLADIIRNKDNTPPLTIGLYAPWGSGKTHLINLIKKHLKNDKKIKFIDFDAWQYNDQEHIWAALVMKFMQQCEKNLFFYFRYLIWKLSKFVTYENCLKLLIYWGIMAVFIPGYLPEISKFVSILIAHPVIFSFIFTFLPDWIKYPNFNINNEFLNCLKTPTYEEHLGFRNDITELINLTIKFLTLGNKRIVLVIDNLDRCSQENIMKILDAISQFLTSCTNGKNHNIATIFAIDHEIVKAAVKSKLAVNNTQDANNLDNKAEEYLDKIINIPFTIPAPQSNEDFLLNSVDDNNENIVRFIADVILPRKNLSPRQIQKYINELILFKNLHTGDVNDYLLPTYLRELYELKFIENDLLIKKLLDYRIIRD